MRYLARREYASAELTDKLVRRGYDESAVRSVVRALAEAGLQDDHRFTEAFVRSRIARGHGPVKIGVELRRRGIDDAGDVLADAADWFELAREQRRRRFGDERPADWGVRAAQARFLEQRGFTRDQIKAALDGEE
ncbi:MAG: regulatory protein RecX [Gammaproteobacteria bacterium]